MTKAADNLAQYMPKQFRSLHEGILAQIARTPDQQKHFEDRSQPQDGGPDLSVYLGRIERASRIIQSNSARVRELEESIYDLKQQHTALSVQLNAANDRAAQLEQQVAAEKNRVVRAEAVAVAADQRAKELEQALKIANGQFEALTAAIDAAFKQVAEGPAVLRNVA